MKVSDFSGGINLKRAAAKLQPNESVELVDGDIASGELRSAKGLSAETYASVQRYFHQYENVIISQAGQTKYVDYVGDAYYIKDSKLTVWDGAAEASVGLAQPTDAPDITQVVNQPTNNLTVGIRSYLTSVKTASYNSGTGTLVAGQTGSFGAALVDPDTDAHVDRKLFTANSPEVAPGDNAFSVDALVPRAFKARVTRASSYREPELSTYRLNEVVDNTYNFILDELGTFGALAPSVAGAGLEYATEYTYLIYNKYPAGFNADPVMIHSEPIVITITTPSSLGEVTPTSYETTTYGAPFVDLYDTNTNETESVPLLLREVSASNAIDSPKVNKRCLGVYDGIQHYSDYIEDLSAEPEYIISPNLTGTYAYVYTRYDPDTGAESKPSPISSEAAVTKGVISLAFPAAPPYKTRIYRVGGTLTKLSLVEEVASGVTAYADGVADSEVVGTLLTSETYDIAPDDLTLLTEVQGTLFGAVGARLHFTVKGLVFAWPTANFIDFSKDITLLAECVNGLIVCTVDKTYIITGSTPATYSVSLVSGEFGCVSSGSYHRLRNGVIFQSQTNLCFTTGGNVELLTKDKFNPLGATILESVVYNNTYYGISADDIFILNLTDGSFYTLSQVCTNIGIVDGVVQVLVGSSLYRLFGGADDLSLTYLSPVFAEGAHSEIKLYKSFYVAINGTFTVEIFLGGVSVVTKDISGRDTFEVKVPQALQRAIDAQVKITGVGVVYEYEWKALGRQNGK